MVFVSSFERKRGHLSELAARKNVTVIDLIKQALEEAGSINGAALLLNVVPNTVRFHMKKAGLSMKAVVTVQFETAGEK